MLHVSRQRLGGCAAHRQESGHGSAGLVQSGAYHYVGLHRLSLESVSLCARFGEYGSQVRRELRRLSRSGRGVRCDAGTRREVDVIAVPAVHTHSPRCRSWERRPCRPSPAGHELHQRAQTIALAFCSLFQISCSVSAWKARSTPGALPWSALLLLVCVAQTIPVPATLPSAETVRSRQASRGWRWRPSRRVWSRCCDPQSETLEKIGLAPKVKIAARGSVPQRGSGHDAASIDFEGLQYALGGRRHMSKFGDIEEIKDALLAARDQQAGARG